MSKLELKAYQAGYSAATRGVTTKNNPFLDNSDQGKARLRGWNDAKAA